jgi:hypothetical protein
MPDESVHPRNFTESRATDAAGETCRHGEQHQTAYQPATVLCALKLIVPRGLSVRCKNYYLFRLP